MFIVNHNRADNRSLLISHYGNGNRRYSVVKEYLL
nr:MAG TPA: hypothetical protein [Bacteriophage sp.]